MGSMEGRRVKVVEVMQRRRSEILCVRETKCKGDRARRLVGGCKMLNAVRGDERSNGVAIIVS